MTRVRMLLSRFAARLLRPAVAPLHERVDRLADAVRAIEPRMAAMEESLRDLNTGLARHAPGASEEGRKYRQELAYWCWLIKTDEGRRALPGPFEEVFGRWQRDRLRELALFQGLSPSAGAEADGAVDDWCARQAVVEIGGGPFPAIAAAARWRRAVAVDPLACGYAREGLFPASALSSAIAHVEACGERVPLPDGCADLVIIENALDHVTEPIAVIAECRRLLRDGGLLWLLVDLSRHRDPLHPHPFDEDRIRGMLTGAGFEIVRERVSSHHSHPKAYGEYRGLLRRSAAAPHVEVKARAASEPVG